MPSGLRFCARVLVQLLAAVPGQALTRFPAASGTRRSGKAWPLADTVGPEVVVVCACATAALNVLASTKAKKKARRRNIEGPYSIARATKLSPRLTAGFAARRRLVQANVAARERAVYLRPDK